LSLIGEVYWRDRHPWIVISESGHSSGLILCVNLTTLDEECPDDECILHKADYEWIEDEHSTAVAFSRAKLWEESKFIEAIRRGILKAGRPKSIPEACLKKILTAARMSKQLGHKKKELLPRAI
jgi:hypothetical protein